MLAACNTVRVVFFLGGGGTHESLESCSTLHRWDDALFMMGGLGGLYQTYTYMHTHLLVV